MLRCIGFEHRGRATEQWYGTAALSGTFVLPAAGWLLPVASSVSSGVVKSPFLFHLVGRAVASLRWSIGRNLLTSMKTRSFLLALFVGIFSASLVAQTTPAQVTAQINANPSDAASIVAAAVASNPSQASAIVAAALAAQPGQVDAIVYAAVNALKTAAVAITQAAVNAQPDNAPQIVRAAGRAASDQFAAIQAAAVATLQSLNRPNTQQLVAAVQAVQTQTTQAIAAVTPVDPAANVSPSTRR